MLVTPSQSSHWYYQDTSPAFEILGKNGKMRSVTIKDARALNLFPSVTTITSILANPSLEAWKNNQLVLAALTLPKQEGENLEAYAYRIIDDSKQHAKQAATKGTNIHAAIETFVRTGEKQVEDFDHLFAEIEALKLFGHFEKRFVHQKQGYAGSVDYIGFMSPDKNPFSKEFVIADFKTQATKEGKYKIYDSWKQQLCAYMIGVKENGLVPDGITPALYNIIISSTEKDIWLYKYTIEDIEENTDIFMSTKNIFYRTKGLKRPWIE